jgi:hypothetical protein
MIGIACSAADAITIYSTFGEGDTFGGGVSESADTYDFGYIFGSSGAAYFTPGQEYTLDSVTLALGLPWGATNVTISITTDNAGTPSTGDPLEVLATNPGNITNTPAALTYTSTTNPTLSAGTKYWVVIDMIPGGPEGQVAWYANDQGVQGDNLVRYYNSNEGGWQPWQLSYTGDVAAFRVEGTAAVPEPSTVAFFGMGLIGLIGAGWRRYAPRFKNRDCC